MRYSWWWQCAGDGMSSAGLPSKNPVGLSLKPMWVTGITGQSSGRTMWWAPNVYQSDHVGVLGRAVGRDEARQAVAAGVLVRVVAGGEALLRVVRRHPDVVAA